MSIDKEENPSKTTLIEFLYQSFGENKEKTEEYLKNTHIDIVYDHNEIPYNVDAFVLQFETIVEDYKKTLAII